MSVAGTSTKTSPSLYVGFGLIPSLNHKKLILHDVMRTRKKSNNSIVFASRNNGNDDEVKGTDDGHNSVMTSTTRSVQVTSTPKSFQVLPPPSTLPQVIYENDYILAVKKPPGLSYHDDTDEDGVTIVPGLVSVLRWMQQQHLRDEQHGSEQSIISYKGRLYGVHRLDRVTSGIVLFAKSSQVAGLLSKAFRFNQITKYYCALSLKRPTKKKQGWVIGQMIRSRRGSWKLVRPPSPSTPRRQHGSTKTKQTTNSTTTTNTSININANTSAHVSSPTSIDTNSRTTTTTSPAKTRFFTKSLVELLAKNNNEDHDSPKTFMLFKPITGQTHQLRVASKSVGLPILGDRTYGGGTSTSSTSQYFGNRVCLHASAIHLNLKEIGITPTSTDEDDDVIIICPPTFFSVQNDQSTGMWSSSMSPHSTTKTANDVEADQSLESSRSVNDRNNNMIEHLFYDMMMKHCDNEALKQSTTSLIHSRDDYYHD